MHSFQIRSNEQFPIELSGIVVPDDGETEFFNSGIENYYGSDDPIIGLFVSEFTTTAQIPFISNGVELANLQALVTFGIHRNYNKFKETQTHLEFIARELKLPLLQLRKPPEIRLWDQKGGENYNHWLERHYIPKWINNNPLRGLYRRNVSITTIGTSATISPV
jgi:hypothetical protein